MPATLPWSAGTAHVFRSLSQEIRFFLLACSLLSVSIFPVCVRSLPIWPEKRQIGKHPMEYQKVQTPRNAKLSRLNEENPHRPSPFKTR